MALSKKEYLMMIRIREEIQGAEKTLKKIRELNRETNTFRQALKTGFGIDFAQNIRIGITRLAQTYANFIKTGISFNGTIEQSEVAFSTLLKSEDKAHQRLKELITFAATTPFQLPGVIDANRQLLVLTEGQLATRDGMLLVGDAAAAVGRDFQETGFWIGRLYSGLQKGTPIGEATMRLLEMGLITGDLKQQLDGLVAQGIIGGEAWDRAAEHFSQFTGAMQRQSQTWNGMLSTLKDTWNQIAAEFAQDIFLQFKDSLRDVLELLGAVQGKLEEFESNAGKKRQNIISRLGSVSSQKELEEIRNDSQKAIKEKREEIDELMDQKKSLQTAIKELTSEDKGVFSAFDGLNGGETLKEMERIAPLKAEISSIEEKLGILRQSLKNLINTNKEANKEIDPESLKANAQEKKRQAELAESNRLKEEAARKTQKLSQEIANLKQEREWSNKTVQEQILYLIEERTAAEELFVKRMAQAKKIDDAGEREKAMTYAKLQLDKAELTIEKKLGDLQFKRSADLLKGLKEDLETRRDRIKVIEEEQVKLYALANPEARAVANRLEIEKKQLLEEILELYERYRQKALESGMDVKPLDLGSTNDPRSGLGMEGKIRYDLQAWLDQFGDTASQISDVLTGTLQGAIEGIADSIEGLINGTMTWGEAFSNVAVSIGAAFARMIAEFIAQQLVLFTVRKLLGIKSLTTASIEAAKLTAIWTPPANLANIATLGAAAAQSPITLAGSMAASQAVTTAFAAAPTFYKGGYTGKGNKNRLAGGVHYDEYVLDNVVTRKLGVPTLDNFVRAVKTNTAMPSMPGGVPIPGQPSRVTVNPSNQVAIAFVKDFQDAEEWAISQDADDWFVRKMSDHQHLIDR